MSSFAIRVENLSKKYRIGARHQQHNTLRDQLVAAVKGSLQPKHLRCDDATVWALRDVTFDVEPGEVLGIIGHNGAGKSTLFKILSRITKPTNGRATIEGRVGSLLEVGTGFHSELTGRENIYLNGAILGMSHAEIRSKFDEIVAFADIEKFINTPVKRYSSGMYMRLAFAVAAHLEPEILLIDEVLAVGDAAFQKKCLGKMRDVAKGGRTILFVSHNMGAILELCNRCLVIEGGRIVQNGSTRDIVADYQSSLYPVVEQNIHGYVDLGNVERYGSGGGRFTSIKITPLESDGTHSPFLRTGGDLQIDVHIASITGFSEAITALIVYDAMGYRLIDVNTALKNSRLSLKPGEEATVQFRLFNVLLRPDTYLLGLWLGRPGEDIDGILHCSQVTVEPNLHALTHFRTYPGPYQCEFTHAIMTDTQVSG